MRSWGVLCAWGFVVSLGATPSLAQTPGNPIPGRCEYKEVLLQAREPIADLSCNPMLSDRISQEGWTQYSDDVCHWYWEYAMARIQRYVEYANKGFNIQNYGRAGPLRIDADQESVLNFVLTVPPMYVSFKAVFAPNYYGIGADNKKHQLWFVRSSRLDPYVAAAMHVVRPPPLPESMQRIAAEMIREGVQPGEQVVHGFFFSTRYNWTPPPGEEIVPSAPRYSVYVRCIDYVRSWAQEHKTGWVIQPFIPGQNSMLEQDLIPR